jgi:hypothetical protein
MLGATARGVFSDLGIFFRVPLLAVCLIEWMAGLLEIVSCSGRWPFNDCMCQETNCQCIVISKVRLSHGKGMTTRKA